MSNIFGLSGQAADIIGIIGTMCIVGAYAYLNFAAKTNALLFNLINLVGASMLAVSLTVHFNMASLVLEFIWVLIALFGIGKALFDRRRARRIP